MLHAAAWTDVDGAEDEPQEAAAVNVGGTANAASARAPHHLFSSDYVFDGSKREPYVESDGPNPLSAYGRSKLHGEGAAGEQAWVVRSSWLFGPTSRNFLLTMLRLGAERDEVAVVDDQRGSPTYVGHLAAATRELVESGAPFGLYHVAAAGECTWAEFAEAIFAEAGLDCRCGGSRPRVRREGAPPRVLGAPQRTAGDAAPCRTGARACAPVSSVSPVSARPGRASRDDGAQRAGGHHRRGCRGPSGRSWATMSTASRWSCPLSGKACSTGCATDEKAFTAAREEAERTADALPGETVDARAGEADVGLAIRDVLATFPADEIVVAIHAEDEAAPPEAAASETASREIDGVPVRRIVVRVLTD